MHHSEIYKWSYSLTYTLYTLYQSIILYLYLNKQNGCKYNKVNAWYITYSLSIYTYTYIFITYSIEVLSDKITLKYSSHNWIRFIIISIILNVQKYINLDSYIIYTLYSVTKLFIWFIMRRIYGLILPHNQEQFCSPSIK